MMSFPYLCTRSAMFTVFLIQTLTPPPSLCLFISNTISLNQFPKMINRWKKLSCFFSNISSTSSALPKNHPHHPSPSSPSSATKNENQITHLNALIHPWNVGVHKVARGSTVIATRSFDTGKPLSSLAIALPAGTRWESEDQPGLGNVLKNLLFLSNGLDSKLAIARKLELMGGCAFEVKLNRDMLLITTTFPRHHQAEMVELLEGMLHHPLCKQHELKEVLGTRLHWEFEQKCSKVEAHLDDAIHRAAYQTGSLGNSLHLVYPAQFKELLESDELLLEAAREKLGVPRVITVYDSDSDGTVKDLVTHRLIKGGSHPKEHHQSINSSLSHGGSNNRSSPLVYLGSGEERIEMDIDSSVNHMLIVWDCPNSKTASLLYALMGGYGPFTHHFHGNHKEHHTLVPHKEHDFYAPDFISSLTKEHPHLISIKPYKAFHGNTNLLGIYLSISTEATIQNNKSLLKKIFEEKEMITIDEKRLERAQKQWEMYETVEMETRLPSLCRLSQKIFFSFEGLHDVANPTPHDVKKAAKEMFGKRPSIAVVSSNLRRIPYLSSIFN